jgi:hypothetical protein
MNWSDFFQGVVSWFTLTVIVSMFMTGFSFFNKVYKGEKFKFEDYCSDLLVLSIVITLTMGRDFLQVFKKAVISNFLLFSVGFVGVVSLLACCNAYSNLNHRKRVSAQIPNEDIPKIEQDFEIEVTFAERNDGFVEFRKVFTQRDRHTIKLVEMGNVNQKLINSTAKITIVIGVISEIGLQVLLAM